MPRGLTSATYWTRPVTFSAPSGRGMERPTPLISRVVFIVAMTLSLSSGAAAVSAIAATMVVYPVQRQRLPAMP